jgi:hypothetical protein
LREKKPEKIKGYTKIKVKKMKNKIISKQTTIKIKIVENKDSHFSNCVANKKLKKFV